MIYHFSFIITNGVEYIDSDGKRTDDRKRAHHYPYRGEASAAAEKFGPSFKVRELD
jgi:hypothetical protein